MKFDYTVKYNGIWYKPGEEVPSPGTSVKPKTEEPKEEIAEPVVEKKKEETTERAYTKTQILRMSASEANRLGKELGLDGLGQALKQKIIEHYGL